MHPLILSNHLKSSRRGHGALTAWIFLDQYMNIFSKVDPPSLPYGFLIAFEMRDSQMVSHKNIKIEFYWMV